MSISSIVSVRSRTLLQAAFLVVCSFLTFAQAQQVSQGPLTNASVVKLVKAGFRDKTIIAIIHSRPNQFKLDTEELIQLKRQGISENIILAMLSQDDSFGAADDEWSDNSFFRDPNRKADNSNAQDPGTNIFGMGGSSNSRTQSRAGNGASQSEGDITGSATVRILRPPTEAGGVSSSKLEKTPTLNNESIVRLVEAGFSEGTIIKRIEQSPAEFDLSPAKLDELRRRRVTEPIIAAMTAAMGGDDVSPSGTRKKSEQ